MPNPLVTSLLAGAVAALLVGVAATEFVAGRTHFSLFVGSLAGLAGGAAAAGLSYLRFDPAASAGRRSVALAFGAGGLAALTVGALSLLFGSGPLRAAAHGTAAGLVALVVVFAR